MSSKVHVYQDCFVLLYLNTGADPETLLTGGLSYGTIFSIIDGINCSRKPCFISFSVQ
jgi:hypothetical protein